MLSAEATRTRVDDGDHKNHVTDAASSGGSAMTRVVWRELVERIVSPDGRTVAMCAPLGLGKDWVEAMVQCKVRDKSATPIS